MVLDPSREETITTALVRYNDVILQTHQKVLETFGCYRLMSYLISKKNLNKKYSVVMEKS